MSAARKAATPQPPPKYLLSIDPAKQAGWALFVDGKPSDWGACDGSTWQGYVDSIGTAISADWADATRHTVIEDGYMGPGNRKGALTLGRRRGLAQAAGEYFGFRTFDFIGPSTWQNGLGWRRGQDTKEFSLKYVEDKYGIIGISDDTSDALALGAYYLQSLDTSLVPC